MDANSHQFLRRLLDSPGPSGFETLPASVWRAEAETFADAVSTDVAGNTTATINPGGVPGVMFAGHIDEIGLMVVHVDEKGFVFFAPIGGWDSQVIVGQRVIIASKDGPVRGVVGKEAIHLMKQADREKVSKPTDLWIDIGANSRDEALERIRIGDPAVLDASSIDLPHNRLASRSVDNRIGAYIVLEALRLLASDPPEAAVHAVATTKEEIGWTGGGARTSAAAIDPAVAIVVDVTHATDYPDAPKKEAGDYKLGGGPVLSRGSAVNPRVFDLLAEVADAEHIPYAICAAPKDTGTDADAIYSARFGIATGLVSVPNRYMHSPNEIVDLADVDYVARLLAGFARRVSSGTSFIPE